MKLFEKRIHQRWIYVKSIPQNLEEKTRGKGTSWENKLVAASRS